MKAIFDRFIKIEKDPHSLYRGVGLGLSISLKLAELIGGKLWAESKLGSGSTFRLSLPEEVISDLIPKRRPIETTTNEVPDWAGKSILVVEDEKVNLLFLEKLLQKTKCGIVHAGNGREAVDRFQAGERFDVVLMDIKMPVLNGADAQALIRKIEPSQYIIAQTALAHKEERDRLLSSGFDDYVAKPIDQNRLFSILKELLDRE